MAEQIPHVHLEHDYFKTEPKSVGTQSSPLEKNFEVCEAESKRLREEAYSLRLKLADLSHEIDSFRENDKKTFAYTPFEKWSSLLGLHERLEKKVNYGQNLSKFQLLLLFLMRLKMNLPSTYLSNTFNISEASVNRIFNYLLDLLYNDLKELLLWMNVKEAAYKENSVMFVHFITVNVDTGTALVPASVSNSYSLRCMMILNGNRQIHYVSRFLPVDASPYATFVNDSEVQANLKADDVFVSRFPIAEEDDENISVYYVAESEARKSFVKLHNSEKLAGEFRVHDNGISGFMRKKFEIINGAVPNQYVTASGNDLSVLDKIMNVCCGLNNFEKINLSF